MTFLKTTDPKDRSAAPGASQQAWAHLCTWVPRQGHAHCWMGGCSAEGEVSRQLPPRSVFVWLPSLLDVLQRGWFLVFFLVTHG